MSEYQYYEFQAIDRPLSTADIKALRALSTRAQITTTSFTNAYQWGDFKGDPAELMERWFDLHLYFASWGTRCLMIRLPRRLVDRDRFDVFLGDGDLARVWTKGDHLILSVATDADEFHDKWDDGTGWLAALATLRTALLEGDLRMLYLVWLMAVEAELVAPDETEPLPGLGPTTAALEAFASFFAIDRDLIAAASERGAQSGSADATAADATIAAMTDQEKTGFLRKIFDGDALAVNDLRRLVRARMPAAAPVTPRRARDLCARAEAIRQAREQAETAELLADQRRRDQQARRALRARQAEIEKRGDAVWAEIETEIRRGSAAGYDRVIFLLGDLKAIAKRQNETDAFAQRITELRQRYARRYTFVKRLDRL
ncbi:hypothetical protein IP86_14445 [Rhodopseudomonas sp. AAP120]|uniref:hypothetical protein n=1 Tax=Rhodopseudomonas sp. AAP120 TaxID=1523430 RepID=UPI0006B8FB01|nr:hypothetical protein [Rhodopseudomonas sp. AAP120]KPF97094.1 hypothetical protein IP86_14445 [Rhodopseudomonas sp. AAP120]